MEKISLPPGAVCFVFSAIFCQIFAFFAVMPQSTPRRRIGRGFLPNITVSYVFHRLSARIRGPYVMSRN
ncbi:MAG: hypothetical protein LBD37_08405 [Treponema sp.]|jgi:hypothetical protein|nr:hypothetical protein [Treponema sp.]